MTADENRILDWRLPEDVAAAAAGYGPRFPDDAARMELVIALARANIVGGHGGPFGAAVFDHEQDELVACGVNLVFTSRASVAHAEIVALTAAQRHFGSHDLGGRPLTLATSAEPCAMCLGAVPWSGIRRLVIGAADADIRRIGYDEGSKPAGWVEALSRRGVEVVRDVARESARAALEEYQAAGGRLY